MRVLLHTQPGQRVNASVKAILAEAKKLSGVEEEMQFAPLSEDFIPPRGVPVLSLGTPPKEVSERCRVVQMPSIKEMLAKSDTLSRCARGFRLLAQPMELPEFQYEVLDTHLKLDAVFQKLDRSVPLVIDTEVSGDIKWDSYFEGKLISVAFTQGGMNWVITEELLESREAEWYLRAIIQQFKLIGHNYMFDGKVLDLYAGVVSKCFFDTQLAHFVLYPASESGLKPLAKTYFGVEDWDEPGEKYRTGKTYKEPWELEDGSWASARTYTSGSGFERIPRKMLYEYNAFDTYATWLLYEMLEPMVQADERIARAAEDRFRMSDVYTQIEKVGFRIDIEHLEHLKVKLEAEKVVLEAELDEIAGKPINPRSPPQVKAWFHAQGYTKLKATDEKTLEKAKRNDMFDELALEFVEKLLECRGNTKNLSTYVLGFLKRQRGGIIYPSFKLTGAVTGRLSTPGAGIMVIPRDPEYRRMVLPKREGHVIVKPDFGQLEARVVAFLSGDERMVDAFQPNRPDFFTAMMPSVYPDLDITKLNKAELKEKRNGVKPFSHGLNYGRGPEAIAEELGMPIDEARRIAKNYLGDPEKGLMAWQTEIKRKAFSSEEMFTPYGLHLQQELITSRNRSSVANNALAFNPQSIGNSICVDALMHIMVWIGDYGDSHVFGTVHDQILASVPIEHAEEVGNRMQLEMEEAGNRFAQGVLIFEAEAEYGWHWSDVMNPTEWAEWVRTNQY